MQLREFAQQILFATSLEGKLLAPTSFEDSDHRICNNLPPVPGRPSNLKFDVKKRQPFPSLKELEGEAARARVFHFFANHELLALELMALALLKFPTAPESFRRGLAYTMLEEQKHLKLYRQRMAALGMELGEVPVNDFFWRALSPMPSLLHYVAGMSLTFEQANLDFSIFYKKAFARLGDAVSAGIMEVVYREEIGHVHHGVKWFDRWRDAGESRWQSYRKNLDLPLSPARAKGMGFERAGRVQAGLDEEFMDELAIYPKTHGQPPRVFWYNAACEQEWAAGKGYTMAEGMRLFLEDFSCLLLFIAQPEDLVLCRTRPGARFLLTLQKFGYSLPGFLTCSNLNAPDVAAIAALKPRALVPWGWSPKAIALHEELERNGALLEKNCDPNHLAEVFAKTAILPLRQQLRREFPSVEPCLGPVEVDGEIAQDLPAVLAYAQMVEEKWGLPTVVKMPYGAAGQGMVRLIPKNGISPSQRGWLEKVISHHRQVLMEPWLEKVSEFSFQLKISPEKITAQPTRFLTDRRGQYLGHWLGDPFQGLGEGEREELFFNRPSEAAGKCYSLLSAGEAAARLAGKWLQGRGFQGYAGVDTFTYKLPDGRVFTKALGEINPRYTMGHIALALAKPFAAGVSAFWLPVSMPRLQKLGYESLKDFANVLRQRFPTAGNPRSGASGVYFTNDPQQARAALGIVGVGNEAVTYLLSSLGSLD